MVDMKTKMTMPLKETLREQKKGNMQSVNIGRFRALKIKKFAISPSIIHKINSRNFIRTWGTYLAKAKPTLWSPKS